jgi:pimeloyl-ACP methyl ester carboxylesterase
MPTNDLRIRVLGDFEVTIGDATYRDGAWPTAAANVVKLLALQPDRSMTRSQLIDALWPDVDADTGANRLYKALHQLRQATNGHEPLVTTANGLLSLTSHALVDVADFRAAALEAKATGSRPDLERAVDLYRGELLPGDTYEEWTFPQRDELSRLVRDLQLEERRQPSDQDNRTPTLTEVPYPPIHHVTTPDGCRIAYHVLGSGPPLVHMSQIAWNDLVLEWEIPAWQAWHRGLANGRTLIRYDSRGLGQSQREIEHLTVSDLMCDLEAVVDAVGLDQFDLFSGIHSCLAAIRFSVERPDRVRRLVLWAPYSRPADLTAEPMPSAGLASAPLDWEWYCRNAAAITLSLEHHEIANQMAEMLIASSSPETVAHAAAGCWTEDVTDLLSDLELPVLILHPPQPEYPPQEAAVRVLTARIPDARLALVPKSAYSPIAGDTENVLALIHQFLDED